MTDALYGSVVDFGDDQGDPQPAVGLMGMQAQMAAMILGPIMDDEGIRDSLRDATAAALAEAGVKAVTLHLETDETGPFKVALEPRELAEVFISRIAGEFGFSVPGYLTLAEAAK